MHRRGPCHDRGVRAHLPRRPRRRPRARRPHHRRLRRGAALRDSGRLAACRVRLTRLAADRLRGLTVRPESPPQAARLAANTTFSSSWIMRAVAPQIISPATSKNHTAKELSAVPGIVATGDAPPLLVEDLRVGQLGERDVEDPLDLVRARHQVGPRGHGRQHRHDQRGRHHGHHRVHPAHQVTRAGSRPTSSCASRSAAAAGASPSSRRPPGKLTSPLCVRRADERRVRTSRVSPAPRTSPRARPRSPGAPRRAGLVDQDGGPSTGSDPRSGGHRAALAQTSSASSTRSSPIPVRSGPRDVHPRCRVPRAPGGRAGDHLGRDGAGHRRHATGEGTENASGRLQDPRPRYALAP